MAMIHHRDTENTEDAQRFKLANHLECGYLAGTALYGVDRYEIYR